MTAARTALTLTTASGERIVLVGDAADLLMGPEGGDLLQRKAAEEWDGDEDGDRLGMRLAARRARREEF